MNDNTQIAVDSVMYAAQIGRLDFLSAILAAISVLMVLGGIFAFINIGSKAEKEARIVAKEVAEKIANSYLQDNMPKIIDSYDEFIKQGVNHQISESSANQIARAQEDTKDDNN